MHQVLNKKVTLPYKLCPILTSILAKTILAKLLFFLHIQTIKYTTCLPQPQKPHTEPNHAQKYLKIQPRFFAPHKFVVTNGYLPRLKDKCTKQ